VWDTLKKRIVDKPIAYTNYDELGTLATLEEDAEGVYLHAIGRRDRYVVVPELPRKDKNGVTLSVGDILSNGGEHLWVIRFDLIGGVYCSLVSMPDSYNKLDILLEHGLVKVGDIFDGIMLNSGENHVAKAEFEADNWL
jgi:hypothetical protein